MASMSKAGYWRPRGLNLVYWKKSVPLLPRGFRKTTINHTKIPSKPSILSVGLIAIPKPAKTLLCDFILRSTTIIPRGSFGDGFLLSLVSDTRCEPPRNGEAGIASARSKVQAATSTTASSNVPLLAAATRPTLGGRQRWRAATLSRRVDGIADARTPTMVTGTDGGHQWARPGLTDFAGSLLLSPRSGPHLQ